MTEVNNGSASLVPAYNVIERTFMVANVRARRVFVSVCLSQFYLTQTVFCRWAQLLLANAPQYGANGMLVHIACSLVSVFNNSI